MYADTITLFNRRKEEGGVIWYPTILRNVDLNADRGAIIAKYGEQSTDKASLHVKFSSFEGENVIAGHDGEGNEIRKRYYPQKEWRSLKNFGGTITFQDGNEFDFFAVGAWADEPVPDLNYVDGLYAYMNKKYDHVYAITSVAKYSVIPHFEILAR